MNPQEEIYIMNQFHLPPNNAKDLLPNLSTGGFDSHAHLDGKAFDNDLDATIARARSVGMIGIVNMFLSPSDYESRHQRFAPYPEIYFALGIHPSEGHQAPSDYLQRMEQAFVSNQRLRALGEIGLDYHWKDCPKDVQESVFIDQLHLAKKLNKAVIIHSREAFDETLAILLAQGFAGRSLLWHCFGGNSEQAKILIANGWDISIPGPASYPKNEELRQALHAIPLDRLHIESDCPYLAPQKHRGKRNEPAYCAYTAQVIASSLNMNVQEVWELTGKNSQRFFGIS